MVTQDQNTFTVLVTGANSGLGLAICQRLIDEFLQTRAEPQSLLLIPTTRSTVKSESAIASLSQYVVNHAHVAEQKESGVGAGLEARVHFRAEQVDLSNLRSVRELARKLCNGDDGLHHLDCIILNAGLGGWVGIDWLGAIQGVLTDLVYAVTYPWFKVAEVGAITKPQLPEPATVQDVSRDEPKLGSLFCANVFGHYVLTHELMPILRRASRASRIIWVSSLEAYAHAFHPDSDFQGLNSKLCYESSKRLTDVLALTSHIPSTATARSSFFDISNTSSERPSRGDSPQRPRMFTTHPGVCATSILPIPLVLTYLMLGAFYLARWLGSIWHTIDPYVGATAPVWLALASEETLESFEAPLSADVSSGNESKQEQHMIAKRASKWGSATDADGRERVERTEVEGWGWEGRPGASGARRMRGRMRGATDLTVEGKKEFENLGVRCWDAMERLRREWEGRLDEAGV